MGPQLHQVVVHEEVEVEEVLLEVEGETLQVEGKEPTLPVPERGGEKNFFNIRGVRGVKGKRRRSRSGEWVGDVPYPVRTSSGS